MSCRNKWILTAEMCPRKLFYCTYWLFLCVGPVESNSLEFQPQKCICSTLLLGRKWVHLVWKQFYTLKNADNNDCLIAHCAQNTHNVSQLQIHLQIYTHNLPQNNGINPNQYQQAIATETVLTRDSVTCIMTGYDYPAGTGQLPLLSLHVAMLLCY